MQETIKETPEPKVCASCGETFGCGARLVGCWCTELEIPRSVADDLKTKYEDCLCPKCLKGSVSVQTEA